MNKVPSLRFKEFSGEWEEKTLNSIFERITEKNKENNDNVLTISAQYGLISQTDFFNKSVAGKDLTKYYLLHKDDFAYNKSYSNGYPMGAIKRLTKYDKGIVSTLYICFRVKNSDDVSFLEQFFESKKIEKSIQDIAQEGARNHGLLNISVGDFFDITINLPCLKEQEKIGNFLSSVDKKISIVEEKLNLFNQYKKGIMQKIFNQELRFKDENGNNYPKWEERKLGDIVELIDGDRGKNYPNENDIKEEGILFLSTSNFFNNKLIFNKNDKFINIEKFNQLTKGKLNKDDLIITLRGSIGNIIVFENKFYNTAFINAQMMIIRPKKDINKYFLYDFFQNSKTQSILQNMSSGSAQPQLTKKDLKNFIVSFPCLEEQKKIADFLSAIDNKIENISGNLENLKLFKKSMLQKMFV